MRASWPLLFARSPITRRSALLNIENATFYRHHPSSSTDSNPPLFSDLSFNVPYVKLDSPKTHYWAIIGPASSERTTFLEILRGQHLCFPPTARSFPKLPEVSTSSKTGRRAKSHGWNQGPSSSTAAIQYVGFSGKNETLGGRHVQGAYLSARYESRHESTDFSLQDYLKGNTSLNPPDKTGHGNRRFHIPRQTFKQVVEWMKLQDLLSLPVSNLSNGQSRRARIAKALLAQPKLLLLDEPFVGIDPMTRATLFHLFWVISRRSGPQIILALAPLDEIPPWITHILYLDAGYQVKFQGTKEKALTWAQKEKQTINLGNQKPAMWKYNEKDEISDSEETKSPEESNETKESNHSEGDNHSGKSSRLNRPETKPRTKRLWSYSGYTSENKEDSSGNEAMVEMQGVRVKYGEHIVLGDWKQQIEGELKEGLWWNINRGDRWALFGPNGSGKTTILSLICSDHPQAYSLPIKLFGRSRLPTVSQPGISVFDIQARMGHASPEIHRFFPRNLTIRQTLESAWADTFLSKPSLSFERDIIVDACLRWFRRELDPESTNYERLDKIAQNYDDKIVRAPSAHDPSPHHRRVDEFLIDVDWADRFRLHDVSLSAQLVALFLRAVIKKPDLVILDEAFSGMDEEARIKCTLFLSHGENRWLRPAKDRKFADRKTTRTLLKKYGKVSVEGLEPRQALLCVSHQKEEVSPLVTRWMCLPEAGTNVSVRFGKILTDGYGKRKGEVEEDWWQEVWGNLRTKWPVRRKYQKEKGSSTPASMDI